MRRLGLHVLLAITILAVGLGADWRFRLQYPAELHPESYSGRVYVFFSAREREPRKGPDWFHPEPFIAMDVEGWKPGEEKVVSVDDEGLLSFPRPLKELNLSGRRAQAVVRFNPIDRNVGTGVGNGYSQPVVLGALPGEAPLLAINQIVEERPFSESRFRKLFRVRSEKLSAFHGRDIYLQGAVYLPTNYESSPDRKYPTIFIVPGFGGTHDESIYREVYVGGNRRGVEFIYVVLDPSCPLGHHVFADSANNGPVGTALVEEFLPEFDRTFRTVAEPAGRFLTGHSSGGWSTLWLQINWPEVFNGTWSTSPDSVDFRDFQRVNVYRPEENVFVDPQGARRPIARRNGQVVIWFDDFCKMEDTLGHGGQLNSFEAVFGPRGEDGQPRLLWDRKTGGIDPQVAEAWKAYDIRLVIEENWDALAPRLEGKLHVIMGDQDSFYLEGATRLLKESLAKLGSSADVQMLPQRTHFNLLSADVLDRIRNEMADRYLSTQPTARAR